MARRAVVIGSSVAGLAAARALSTRFDEVVIVERDARPEVAEPRKGVPQGRHIHALLKSGELALEELFPGLTAELEACGSRVLDIGRDARWFHHGVWKIRFDSGLRMHCQSRPLLELLLRERVAALQGVSFRYQTVVAGLELAGGRVTGARLRDAAGERREPAELVVDASGRGSQLDEFLAPAGYEAPADERVGIYLMYASQLVELAPRPRDFGALLIYPAPPKDKRGGLIFPREDGRHLVTLIGWQGDHPPGDREGFLAFARSLPQPEVHRELLDARFLGEVALHKFPFARRRRFEKLRRFPSGLLALGDAVCSFDPVFGQGMTAAALGALVLGRHLDADPRCERPLRFFSRLGRALLTPWLLATSEDLRYPTCSGARPPGLAALQRYTKEVFALTAESPAVYAQFLRVMNLLAGPEALAHPSVIGRVIPRLLGLKRRSSVLPSPAPAHQG